MQSVLSVLCLQNRLHSAYEILLARRRWHVLSQTTSRLDCWRCALQCMPFVITSGTYDNPRVGFEHHVSIDLSQSISHVRSSRISHNDSTARFLSSAPAAKSLGLRHLQSRLSDLVAEEHRSRAAPGGSKHAAGSAPAFIIVIGKEPSSPEHLAAFKASVEALLATNAVAHFKQTGFRLVWLDVDGGSRAGDSANAGTSQQPHGGSGSGGGSAGATHSALLSGGDTVVVTAGDNHTGGATGATMVVGAAAGAAGGTPAGGKFCADSKPMPTAATGAAAAAGHATANTTAAAAAAAAPGALNGAGAESAPAAATGTGAVEELPTDYKGLLQRLMCADVPSCSTDYSFVAFCGSMAPKPLCFIAAVHLGDKCGYDRATSAH